VGLSDYPIDVRFDYPPRSSRGWAALTIVLVKFLALLPHVFVLFFLDIAQMVVAFVAQLAVAVTGEYPPGMFAFVAGVLRWNTRVSAFVFSLTDRYPPFTLDHADYPVDLAIERPEQSNRLYALFTALVEVVFVAALIALFVHFIGDAVRSTSAAPLGGGAGTSSPSSPPFGFNPATGWTGLLLRQFAALPHLIVLGILGIVAFVIWFVVQWVILFRAVYPRSMFDLSAGIMRWQARVNGYALGLSDRYPPFTFEPSLTAAGPAVGPAAVAPAEWYPDPSGRHGYRFWDGAGWTPHVADGGQIAFDPPERTN
jgi:hypothetical protein